MAVIYTSPQSFMITFSQRFYDKWTKFVNMRAYSWQTSEISKYILMCMTDKILELDSLKKYRYDTKTPKLSFKNLLESYQKSLKIG